MSALAYPFGSLRVRLFHWWLRYSHSSRKIRKYKPLWRAEFSGGDFYAQAHFLVRAGYHNAGVFAARFAVEMSLQRIVLVMPQWREYRGRGLANMLGFLRFHKLMDISQVRRFQKFANKAADFVHGKISDYASAMRLVGKAEGLRNAIDNLRPRALAMKGGDV